MAKRGPKGDHVIHDLLQKTMTPGRDQWGRVQTLAGCVLVALAAGTNYVSKDFSFLVLARWGIDMLVQVYSAYAPQMGKRLDLTSTQLNIIGITANSASSYFFSNQ